MRAIDDLLAQGKTNFVFLGGAGSGKTEISMNFADYLAQKNDKPVHFFDLDMTKPLFRSRDYAGLMEAKGIHVHYQEQFYDAPTTVGGVREHMVNPNVYTVLDIGGDHIGARLVGGEMMTLNRANTVVYYVLNAYRPWSDDIYAIDRTLGEILSVAHIRVDELHMINNPNLGYSTNVEDVLAGCERMEEIIAPYASIDFACVRQELVDQLPKREREYFPLKQYFRYEWSIDGEFADTRITSE